VQLDLQTLKLFLFSYIIYTVILYYFPVFSYINYTVILYYFPVFSYIIYTVILYYFPVRNDMSACGHLSFEGLYIHTSNMNDLSTCGHLSFEGLYTHTSNMNDLFDIPTFVCGRLSFMLQIRKNTFNLSTFV
jgi:hypothetical protein